MSEKGLDNANTHQQARQEITNIRAAIGYDGSEVVVDCPTINTELNKIAAAPNTQELRESMAFFLQRSHNANPDLPQIELFQSQSQSNELAVRIGGKDHGKTCMPADQSDLDKFKPVKEAYTSYFK